MKNIIEKVMNLHGSIAQDVFPKGGILRCSVCGKELDCSTNDCGYYLGHGWPVCCRRTMTLTVKECEE